ncbi:methylmalonyl-CoA mutase [Flavobacteriaceae bacterium Ap0902]|nr:methylmalonyl-CoA mutase [Flavobacteriaceae bacterium Ap0902]
MNDLFQDFGPIDEKQWKTAVQAELKGGDYAEMLITPMPEGFDVKPLYTKSDVATESFLTDKNKWKIISSFIPTTKIPYDSLDGIQLEAKQLEGFQPSESELLFCTFRNELPPTTALNQNTYFDWDFLGDLLEYGHYPDKSQELAIDRLKELKENQSYKNTLALDVSRYQNFGCNHAQQLAFMLLEAAEYVDLTQDAKILDKTLVKNAAGSDFFLEIAKLRAMRILWANFADAYNIKSELTILTETTLRNKSVKDKFNNIIRSTFEAAAGIFGNSDAVLVHPYDELFIETKELALELGFKQQFVLREESFLNHYTDPLKGAYYVEFLTEKLAEKAWELFKKLEKEGGFLKGLGKGSIQRKIKASAQLEQDKFDEGNLNLIGVNKYPNTADVILKDQIKSKAKNEGKTLFETVSRKRLSEKIEQE